MNVNSLPPDESWSAMKGAVLSARCAQERWERTQLRERLKRVKALRMLVVEHARELAQASAGERLRPMSESLAAEVVPLAEACRFLERHAGQILAPRRQGMLQRPIWLGAGSSTTYLKPLGLVLIIGPGNYPLLLAGVSWVQALCAGNAVIIKPGIGGQRSAEAFKELLSQAGFDPRLSVLLDDSVEAGRKAVEALPDKVIFIGGQSAGRQVMAEAAKRGIPCIMELSGADASIVRADADLELASSAMAFGLTFNAGATCIGPRRAFVHASVSQRFITLLAGRLQEREGFDIPQPESDALRPALTNALAHGARLEFGHMPEAGLLRGPLVVSNVRPELPISSGEWFTGALVLRTFDDDAQAIEGANGSTMGLGASIFSADLRQAERMAMQLKCGMTTLNDIIIPTGDPAMAFGGRKASGFGVTRGALGLREMTVPQVVTTTWGNFRPGYDQPRQKDAEMLESYLRFSHARGLGSGIKALTSLVRLLIQRKRTHG